MSYVRRLCAESLRRSSGALTTQSLRQQNAREAVAAATGAFPTAALNTSARCASTTGGRNDSNGSDEGGFLRKLKDLYQEFQLSQDRKLDAVAAEEAQEGRDRLFDDEQRHDPRQSAKHAHGRDSPLISRNPNLCPRSVLFVPGSKPRAMEKIPTLPADCFILDLEDSVGVGSKRQARENIRDFVEGLQKRRRQHRDAQVTSAVNATLQRHVEATGGAVDDAELTAALEGANSDDDASGLYPRLVVRINSPDFDPATAMLDLELVGLLGPAIEGIAIPKTTPRTYSLIKDYIHPDHQLWAFFESPKSVIQAPVICRQQVYQYAVMGYNDLSMELQLPMSAPSLATTSSTSSSAAASAETMSEAVRESLYIAAHLPLWQSTTQVLQAARAYNMFVIDAVFNDPTDKAGFRRSLHECKALGLNGKTLIHPSQIEPTNVAYTPTEADVTWAMRTAEAVRKAQGGVATVDGKMVEELHKRQADRVMALYRSTEAEKQLRAQEAERAAGEAATASNGESGAADGAREPRRSPSRHRSLN